MVIVFETVDWQIVCEMKKKQKYFIPYFILLYIEKHIMMYNNVM